jgi:hypothetical protein
LRRPFDAQATDVPPGPGGAGGSHRAIQLDRLPQPRLDELERHHQLGRPQDTVQARVRVQHGALCHQLATITCPYNTGGQLTENAACGVNIVLTAGGLTLTSGLDWEGDGTILTAPGEDLTLQGAGTWTNGSVGISDGDGNFVINNGGALTTKSVGGSSPTCNVNMFVGVTADGTTASAGTVSLQNVTLTTSADFKLQVGNSKSTMNQAVFNMQDAGGVGASQISVSVPQGGTNTAFIDVYGSFNCNSAVKAGVTHNVTAPMKVETTGFLDVKSQNSLSLTANGQSAFALECQGQTKVGLANPGGAGIGAAGVTCNGKGSNFDTAVSKLWFFGLNDQWSDTGGTGTLELAISGILTLYSPGSTYQQTTVSITDGDLRFSDNSIFKMQGQYSVTGMRTVFDTLSINGAKKNVWIGNNVTVSPQAFGTASLTTWGSVISVNGGGQINSTFATVDGAGWVDSYPGTPPTQLQLQYTP